MTSNLLFTGKYFSGFFTFFYICKKKSVQFSRQTPVTTVTESMFDFTNWLSCTITKEFLFYSYMTIDAKGQDLKKLYDDAQKENKYVGDIDVNNVSFSKNFQIRY